MQLQTCRWILTCNIPIQTCWATEFIDSHQEVLHVYQQLSQTHYKSNTEMNPLPKFLPISCSRQESSLFSLTTPVLSLLMYPCWCTSKLKQYGSLWCIQNTIRIKSTPRCWALQDKELGTNLHYKNPGWIWRLGWSVVFFNYHRRYW